MLTAPFVQSVAVKTRTDYPDDKVKGLVLRVTPTGVKTWCLRYRLHGESKRYTLGSAESLTLSKAREAARKALYGIAAGTDPAEAKRKKLTTGHTVEALVRDYLAHVKPKKRSWQQDAWILRHHVLPHWKHAKVSELTRRHVRELVEPIAARGTPVMANRVLATLCTVLNFGIARDWLTFNPAFKMERPGGEIASRDRVLTDDELRAFWQIAGQEPLIVATFLRVRLLTAQRGGELARLTWADVDMDKGTLTIPAKLAKNGRVHTVPLSPMAQRLIGELPRLDERLFACGFANLMAAAGRVASRMTTVARQVDPTTELDIRGHDLRRTAATRMAQAGIPTADISRVLNHVEAGPKASQVYQRYEFDKEKRIALETWDRVLTGILEEKPAEAVLPFTKRKP